MENSFVIEGVVQNRTEIQEFKSKEGKTFYKANIIVKGEAFGRDATYSIDVVTSSPSDTKIETLNGVAIDDKVKIRGIITSRTWDGKHYIGLAPTEITLLSKSDKVEYVGKVANPTKVAPLTSYQPNTEDDLPF